MPLNHSVKPQNEKNAELFKRIPRRAFPYWHPACSGTKAKPNANTRTLRPDKCLVVKSLDSSLRPVCPSQHRIHRHHHQGFRPGPRLT